MAIDKLVFERLGACPAVQAASSEEQPEMLPMGGTGYTVRHVCVCVCERERESVCVCVRCICSLISSSVSRCVCMCVWVFMCVGAPLSRGSQQQRALPRCTTHIFTTLIHSFSPSLACSLTHSCIHTQVVFDPLDGSSITCANFAVGSIFGIWPGGVVEGRKGREQVAAA